MVSWLVNTAGSNTPAYASEKVRSGVITNIAGVDVVVSENVVTDYGVLFVPQRAITYKVHTELNTKTDEVTHKGTKISVMEAGIAYLTDPRAVTLLVDLNS